MDFTQITEEQTKELKFRHLQAQLLQDTNVSSIFAENSHKELFANYQKIVERFREAVTKSQEDSHIDRALLGYINSMYSFLNPENTKNKEHKKILTAFKERKTYTSDAVSPETQAFSTLVTINENLGIYKKVEAKDIFEIDNLKVHKKIDETNKLFDEKLQMAIADDLFGESPQYNKYRMANATDLKSIEVLNASELAEVTTPIHQHPDYVKIEAICSTFMKKYSISQFQFDTSSVENLTDFKKNMYILDKSMECACERLGIKESAFGVEDTYFKYYNKTASSLGTYDATKGEFSVNADSLFNMQRTISQSSNSVEIISKEMEKISSTITHEWSHLLDNKILKKVQSIQKKEGLTPQYSFEVDSKAKLFLSESDTPVYGLHSNKNLREAVIEFREIHKSFLNNENANLARNEGAKREFMEHFWRGATTANIDDMTSKEKEKYFTENAFNSVYAYASNPNNNDNLKKFKKLMKQNDAKLLHEGFFYHGKGAGLKVPLDADLLLTHNLMTEAISTYQQVFDPTNKSSFTTDAELLDGKKAPEEPKYYTERLEMFARYAESNFYQKENDLLAYTQVSKEEQSKFQSLYTSIIAKTLGIGMLNDDTKAKFLQENPGYLEEKPKEQSKFAMATQKFMETIKNVFGIEKAEDYQLPFSKKEKNTQLLLTLPEKEVSIKPSNEHNISGIFKPA